MPTVLVTGASRGLGLLFVRQYLADGWRVLAVARDPARATELAAIAAASAGLVTVHRADMSDLASIDALAKSLEGTAIDVLLNNAGTMGAGDFANKGMQDDCFGAIDYADWIETLRINLLAPMRMAEVFLPHVLAGTQRKIVTLSSIVGSVALNTRGGLYSYRSSKAALNMVMKGLAVDLAPQGVICVPVHPGWARTSMGGPNAPVDPVDSVTGVRKVIAGLDASQAGKFLTYDGGELPW
ncbi:MAG: SDR family oxidoreductase [Gammaproteobacteria bacterium]|jgi:NAD(P)-dependent dehydrogenase (short-subunit alcohol dehydrogenase family)|nr:SDR family oxidoreductase [Gammaproteobacteria bacterium]